MKNIIYCCTLFFGIILVSGCSDDIQSVPHISDFDFNYSISQCFNCTDRYLFDCTISSTSVKYYWIGMYDRYGTLVAYGPGKQNDLSGGFWGSHIDIGYYLKLNLPSDSYEFYVHVSNHEYSVGNPAERIISNCCSTYVDMNFTGFTCREQCCSNEGTRKYAMAQKYIQDITGIETNILTRYGKPCASLYGSQENAFNAIYCGISNDNGLYSGQVGFGYERNPLIWAVDTAVQFWYWEVRTNGRIADDYYNIFCCPMPPPNNYIYFYRCEIDPWTGQWSFWVRDTLTLVGTYTDSYWNTTGAVASWAGEIYNYEDDMAGTYNDRCIFTGLRYKTISNNNYQKFVISQQDLSSDDTVEWGINRINDTTFEIWDEFPQP